MTRRSQRHRQNMESLAKGAHHQCQEAGCHERGQPCYDSAVAVKPSHYYCIEHRAGQAYCTDCCIAVPLSDRFLHGPGIGFCHTCWFDLWGDPPATQEPADENHGLSPVPPAETRFDALEL